MKNKAFKTKLLTVLLALCMVLSLVPMTAFAADPATETADFTASDGGAAAIALLNQYKSFGAADSTWDNGTKTLTLRGIDFTTKAATAVKLPDRTTIVLADGTTNTITGGDAAIAEDGGYNKHMVITALKAMGDLKVKGGASGTGTLSVTSGTHKNTGEAWTYSCAIGVADGDFEIEGGHITAQGGTAYSADCAFSVGVRMDNSSRRSKILLITGGSLTAIGGESYDTEDPQNPRKSFSDGVTVSKGSISVTGSGKLTAKCVPAMDGEGLAFAVQTFTGDLLVSHNGEVTVAATNGISVSAGGIKLSGGKLRVEKGGVGATKEVVTSNTEIAGSIEVNGGALYAENSNFSMKKFTVTGGTVRTGSMLPDTVNISGGTVQTRYILAKEMTLSNATLTIREPVNKLESGTLYTSPALWLTKLTVNSGTLDVAWDWGEIEPTVFPMNTEDGFPTPLVKIWGDGREATFNGGISSFDTGCAGNIALKLTQFNLGDGMEITGADTDRCQLRSDTPVKIAAATTPSAVENVTLDYENISYKAGDTPRAAASVSRGNCTVAYECWTEIRQPEGGGQWYETGRRWYSDSDKMASLPADERIINFEAGNSYQYNVVLAADSGYSFSNDETVVTVGEDEWGTPKSHNKLEIKESGKELHIKRIYTFDLPNAGQPNAITSAAVENVKLDYKHGDAPQPSARRAGVNMDKYDILYESWEKREKTDEFTTETVAYWYSDESWYQAGEERLTAFDKDGQYQYSVRLKAKDGYTFNGISADDITLNGKSLPEDSDVIVLDEGKSCLVTYGTTLRTVRPLESVTLNGVSTEFYVDGDKPRFNGYSGSAFSDVAYEKWEDKDDRSVGINSDESLNGGYSQLIESFKHGKTYAYGVAFNIADLGLEQGYRFDENTKLYLHGKEVTLNPQQVQVIDGGMTIRFTDVFSMTPEAPWQKIDLVEIEGATINFKAGDKPVFTGTVPESSPNVLRQCEFWEGSDGSGVNSYWFWDQNYEKHITAFESGKTYTYGVYVKAAHGYYFTRDTKLKINGKFYNYHLPEGDPELDNPDFMATLWAVTDLTITPEASQQQAIEVVEIEGATINFKADDKPVFTGKTGDNQPYFIDHERWDTDGAGVASSEYWNNFYGDFDGSWGKRIEAFESGKEYRYGVYLKLTQNGYAEGWRFDKNTKLRINGQSVDLSNKRVDVTDDGLTIWFYDVLTMTPGSSAPHSHSYGTEWKYDGMNHWHECACGDKADTAAHTFKWVTDKEATATEKGSKHEECTVCSYKKAAVEIPATGSGNGSADQPTNPGNTSSPQTGDTSSLALWFAVLFISGGVLTVLGITNKKKKSA